MHNMSANRHNVTIVVLDDEQGVVDYLVEMLDEAGYTTMGFTSPLVALAKIKETAVDLVLADIEMPEMRGTDFMAAVLQARPEQLVILITAFGSIELGVQAVRAGACDFVTKPFKIEALLLVIDRALRERQMRREIVRLRSMLPSVESNGLVAKSKAMRHALDVAERAAGCDLTVLLTGESGTGKGALARHIHDHSAREDRRLVQVNCAALPESLVESELFGAQKGAYTDAKTNRAGLIAEADGGTLFLDEIAELPLEAQAKLLHVLETGKVRALGTTAEIAVDARVIAATNQDLEEALKVKRFRPDLYYRLNVIRLDLPPLRQRPEDLMELVDVFLARACKRLGRPILGISVAAHRLLLDYAFPGNARELANIIDRAVTLADHDTIVPEDLRLDEVARPGNVCIGELNDIRLPLAAVERAHLERVLESTGGNKVQAARILGIDRRTLQRKLGRPEDEVTERL
jgi:DNA-binding NtrC family response regulator